MNISQFKNFLARIKQDFEGKLRNRHSTQLTIEQVAQLLHRHMNGEPFAQKQLLLKSTGQQHLLTWDDLLQYLQEDIYLQQTVKKIELSALSSTEIIDNHQNKFARLIQYVKHKETNAIQSIYPLCDSVGHDMFLVCFERKLIVYDFNKCEIIGQLDFKYQLKKIKMMEEHQQPKAKLNEQINLEKSDEVGPIPRKNPLQKHSRLSHNSVNFLTNNIKSSVRGSSISSEVSNDRIFLRRFNTDSLDNRHRSKSNQVKIKNDNVHKRASVENSLAIAQAFTQACNNHQKSIVIDKKALEKQKIQKPLEFSSTHIRKNFNQDLERMRKTSKQLDKITFYGHSEMLSSKQHSYLKSASSKQRHSASRRHSTTLFKSDSEEEMPKNMEFNGKSLQIVHLSTLQNLVLISFYNCQIRLLVLKHTLGRVTEQVIFQSSFNQIVSFVQIYRSQKSGLLHMALALQKSNHTEIVVYCFQKQTKSKRRKFSQKLSFVARCQGTLPLGILLYNQCGKFSLLQLNNSLSHCQQQIRLTTELYNKESGHRISINQVRAHRSMTQFYLGCSHGYIYQYDLFSKTVKYQTQVSQQSVLDICLIRDDSELICLLANGNMMVLSSLHLQQNYIYQSYRYIPPESRLMLVSPENIYVYNTRTISCYKLSRNEQKAFSNSKPLKLLESRLLLKRRQVNQHHFKKAKVLKVIEGVGGNNDFLALLIEHGQVIILGHQLTYIGSYHILKVDNIVDLACNTYYQFIALLFDDNSIEVINLYTQNVVFHLNSVNESVDNSSNNKVSSALQKFLKIKNPQRASVRMVNFFERDQSQFFLAVISKDNFIYHYDMKGTMELKINLSQRLGNMELTGPMVFNCEELILGHRGDAIILHRKSYLRKYVILVGDSTIVHLKRCSRDKSILCGVDNLNRLFLIDLQLRKSNYFQFNHDVFKYDTVLFNQLMLLKYYDQTCSIYRTDYTQINISVDNNKYYLAILQNQVIRVSKHTGLLARLDFQTAKFQDWAI